MGNITREEKLKLLEKLPLRLQELMTSEDTGATLLYLGRKYHLSDHQVRLLSKILGNVILGIVPATNLPSEVSTKVAVDTQTASGLAQDLNDLILSPKPAAVAPTPTPMPRLAPPPAPTITMPEVIDLRKTPVAPAPIPPSPRRSFSEGGQTPRPAPPLTFTKLIEPPQIKTVPLIEAEPHKIAPPSNDAYREPVIIRPPGLPPTDFPRDILDLRKDKGEF